MLRFTRKFYCEVSSLKIVNVNVHTLMSRLRSSTGERRPGQMPLCSLVTFPITAFRGGVVSVQQKMDFIRGVTVMCYVLGMRQGWLGQLPADIKCNGLSLHYVSIDPPKVQSVFMTSIHH